MIDVITIGLGILSVAAAIPISVADHDPIGHLILPVHKHGHYAIIDVNIESDCDAADEPKPVHLHHNLVQPAPAKSKRHAVMDHESAIPSVASVDQSRRDRLTTANVAMRKPVPPSTTPISIAEDAAEDNGEDDSGPPIAMRPTERHCVDHDGAASPLTVSCPAGLMIGSISVSRGASCGTPAATAPCGSLDRSKHGRGACLGQAMCFLTEASLGEICPGNATGPVSVNVECEPWRSERVHGNSTSCSVTPQRQGNVTLSCLRDKDVITSIEFASYGEHDGSCKSGIAPGNCSRNVRTDMVRFCMGKPSCQVAVDTRTLGVPCRDGPASNQTTWSLAAGFKCGPGNGSRSASGYASSGVKGTLSGRPNAARRGSRSTALALLAVLAAIYA